ncbi:hypothetical protein CAEBREN_09390 [Caenorhabditis brenneri]|uniref:BHLH domain-containing protein n=1 Tax=Caenorhabditis brenneri TaxID=135651 RepID=G0NI00_CAEBE|nr:hypothetical protein CAEBREN_09390 [Caenorhabditis brenneri]
MKPTSTSPSTPSSTIHQEEPMDLTLGNPILELTADLQQQQPVQPMMTLDDFVKQNMSLFQQTLMRLQTSNPPTAPNESSENDLKENGGTPKKVLTIEENESTPSPTKRQISTGKVDGRMTATPTTRRTGKNARERSRQQTLTKTLEELKNCLPFEEGIQPSKIAILKVAIKYIGFLGAVLAGNTKEEVEYQERLLCEMESAKAPSKRSNHYNKSFP